MASTHQDSLWRFLSHQLMMIMHKAKSANPSRQSAYQGTGATWNGAMFSRTTNGVPSVRCASDR